MRGNCGESKKKCSGEYGYSGWRFWDNPVLLDSCKSCQLRIKSIPKKKKK